MDHNFGAKWHLMASYRYYKLANLTDNQVEIGDQFAGDTLGHGHSRGPRPNSLGISSLARAPTSAPATPTTSTIAICAPGSIKTNFAPPRVAGADGTFVEQTNPPSVVRWMMKMGGSSSEKPDVYRRTNVLLQVDKVKTPLLVMHGENDPQVPEADSALFVKALKEHLKTVFYFIYPNELHGFSQPAHRLDALEKQLAFLEHCINPKLGTSNTNTEEVAFPGVQQTGSHAETNRTNN